LARTTSELKALWFDADGGVTLNDAILGGLRIQLKLPTAV